MTEPGSTTGDGSSQGSDTNQSGWGGSTLWSVVLLAGSQAPGAKEALEQLCRRYWQPVYAYIRRRGHDKCQAEDLTQGVFAHLLAHEGLTDLDVPGGSSCARRQPGRPGQCRVRIEDRSVGWEPSEQAGFA